ncbi:MAG TPA: hypothetical protein VGB51_04050, partial [Actinomycetota bacterium]
MSPHRVLPFVSALVVALVVAMLPSPAGTGEAGYELTLGASAEPRVARVGDDIVFALVAENRGPDAAPGVQLRFFPPAGVVVGAATVSTGACSGESPVVCEAGDLPAGAAVDARVTVTATRAGALGGQAEASGQPTAEQPAPQPARAGATADAQGRSCDAVGTQEADQLAGSGVVCGLGGDDNLAGGAGDDRLLGGSGDDTLSGAGGSDLLDGGDGEDIASFGRAVVVDLDRGSADGEGRDRLAMVEGASGSPESDVLLGSERADRLLGGAGSDLLSGGPGPDELDGGPGRDACDRGPGRGPRRSCESAPFAVDGAITLFELSRATVGYGYHQSLFGAARPMTPVRSGSPSLVMSSRGRGTGLTTAVDVVVPSGSAVLAPVSGRVVAVQRYLLYCAFLDWKVVIRPRERPDLRVMVLHMARPRVSAGTEVAAGSTLIGVAAANDLASSQANRYFPDHYPHVHVEVEPGYA